MLLLSILKKILNVTKDEIRILNVKIIYILVLKYYYLPEISSDIPLKI